MPQDPTPRPEPSGAVSGETLETVREAIRRHLSPQAADSHLRTALRRLSAEARAKGLQAEQVVILLKQMWGELPEVSQPLAPDERRHLLERLVTLCIQEYYAEE